ncbi:hypothetical protein IFM89_015185 [Coptis chinensis]|uniref:Uncharacterized protein n=1 Tax=Coptis chinensis TaxID=261450 RepID=A0A835HDD4_9MAGN|nr:hypothetical protein IFM89_015185 [Coptis chinensis]
MDATSWLTLGTRSERNKENTAIPTTWNTNKISKKPGSRAVAVSANSFIEVFVDEECMQSTVTSESDKSSMLQLRQGDSRDFKKETELLKEDPLRNFPQNSLPR